MGETSQTTMGETGQTRCLVGLVSARDQSERGGGGGGLGLGRAGRLGLGGRVTPFLHEISLGLCMRSCRSHAEMLVSASVWGGGEVGIGGE